MEHTESMIASDSLPEVLNLMPREHESQDHQGARSEYIRQIVQQPTTSASFSPRRAPLPPKTIVQFWHDLNHLPLDVEECIQTWAARSPKDLDIIFLKKARPSGLSLAHWVRGTRGHLNAVIIRR